MRKARNVVDHDIRTARAGLTQIIEPADSLGVHAVEAWGPLRVVDIISGSTPTQQDWINLSTLDSGDGKFTSMLRNKLGDAIQRWRRRREYFQPKGALNYMKTLGGRFIIPEDESWPAALTDLRDSVPLGLWALGTPDFPPCDRAVSIVGSREATPYGEKATTMFVDKARELGLTVISGGAYGIDAQAHRAALGTKHQGLPTIAVLAGGLDRLYPAGNTELLRRIAAQGLLVTEMPPGMRPNRYRFLNRNRLIAALSATSVVIEARYRSGALSTANHAHDLGRTVAAVPGPINVPTSAGCHRMIKETPTLLIDDPEDLATLYGAGSSNSQRAPVASDQRNYDRLGLEEMLVYEALPVNSRSNLSTLSSLTGLGVPQLAAILTRLEREGLADSQTQGWQKRRDIMQ